jgi:hypothetical protein
LSWNLLANTLRKTPKMTIEKAAELVCKLTSKDKIDLFCHFEDLLNPHPPKNADGSWNRECEKWQITFANMCGFRSACNAKSV